jgi:hypothetical protein
LDLFMHFRDTAASTPPDIMGSATGGRKLTGAEDNMATQPVMLQSGVSHLAFWERFQAELESRVREGNAVADDSLWVISRTGGPLCCVTVESAICSGDRLECSFDAERGLLVFAPGPAVNAGTLRFQCQGGKLVCGEREYTLDEALNLALDELVCTYED